MKPGRRGFDSCSRHGTSMGDETPISEVAMYEYDADPCGGNCCADPNVVTPEHEEPEDDDFCEECYCAECLNCGGYCCCDL